MINPNAVGGCWLLQDSEGKKILCKNLEEVCSEVLQNPLLLNYTLEFVLFRSAREAAPSKERTDDLVPKFPEPLSR